MNKPAQKGEIRGIRAIFFDLGNTITLLDYGVVRDVIKDDLPVPPGNRDLALAEYRAREVINDLLLARAGTTDQARSYVYYGTLFKSIGLQPERIRPVVDELLEVDRLEGIWRVVLKETYASLQGLKDKGFRLGVISNADGRVKGLLAKTNLAGYFNVALDSHVVGIEKPDPRIFKLAAEKVKVPVAESVYVGDIYTVDALGSRRAGMTPILMDPLLQYKDLDCVTIAGLGELLQVVKH